MPDSARFQAVFEQLKGLLLPYAEHLRVQPGGEGYSLNTPYVERWNKELFFGGVQIRTSYVSYYLMPVYMFPDLLDGISPRLRGRMQGKSCFNFSSIDQEMLVELGRLTARGYERFRGEFNLAAVG